MKKILLESELSEDLSNYLERLFYEKKSYKELAEIIVNNKGPLGDDREAAKYYGERFVEADAAFNLAIREIVDIYIEDPAVNKDIVSLEASFSTNKVVFTIEEKGACQCSL